VWKRKKTQPAPVDPNEATRRALDDCWDDVSSLRMLGSAPLSDLAAGPAPAAPASGAAPAARRSGAQRWNRVVLALLLLTLAATIGATLLLH
jgi:hypothetical protein